MRESQRGIRSRDDDYTGVTRQVCEGMVDRGEAFLVPHGVQVVKNYDEPALERREAVHQLIDSVLDRTARHAQPPQRTLPEPPSYPVDGRRDVPPKPHRIVVVSVERDPGQ